MAKRIAFVGLGIMGQGMARSALKAGFEAAAFVRRRSSAEELFASGVKYVSSPKAAAEAADAVVTIVTDHRAVWDVLNGDAGILAADVSGKTLIQMSTIDPSESRDIADAVTARGMHYIDAPVVGSKKQVNEAQLIVLAAGDSSVIDQWRPFFSAISRLVIEVGEVGQGSALKLCMNLIVAQMTSALCEAVALARSQDIDAAKIFEVLRNSPALNNVYFQIKEEPLLNGDFSPAFSLANMLKDVDYMTKAASRCGLQLPVTGAVKELMQEAANKGLANFDLTVISKLLVRGSE